MSATQTKGNEMKNLQRQLSNGNWINSDLRDRNMGDDTEYYLELCERNNGINAEGEIVPMFRAERPLTRDEVLSALESGKKLRNDSADWYSNCRYEPAPVKLAPVEMVKCDCGCMVPRGLVMNASLGTTCCDCYDSLSD